MIGYIEGYQIIGQAIASSIGHHQDFNLKLGDIKQGSLVAILSAIPGKLYNKIESYVFEGSQELLNSLNSSQPTQSEKEIEALANQLEEKINYSDISLSAHIDRSKLAQGLHLLSAANEKLLPEEKVTITGKGKVVSIDTHWRFTADLGELFAGKEITQCTRDRLLVKTAVNIGKGVWQFKSISTHQSFSARIEDIDWLRRYQEALIKPIGPKDVMEAEVCYRTNVPPVGKGIASLVSARIQKVIQIHRDTQHQYELDSE